MQSPLTPHVRQMPTMRILHIVGGLPQNNPLTPHQNPSHRFIALDAPENANLARGPFDIEVAMAKVPRDFRPDVLMLYSTSALRPNPPVPTNASKLGIPVVLKLTDSHHQQYPLEKLIDFARQINADYTWTSYDRHHLGLLQLAGLRGLFWFPPAYVITLDILSSLRYGGPREPKAIFRGTVGASHVFRSHLFNTATSQGLQVDVGRKPFVLSLQDSIDATITINASLNGDLNRRFFETLAVGGFLLTDALAPESGIADLFSPGEHFDTYSSQQDFVDKCNYYLAQPELAAQISERARARFLAELNPQRIVDKFYRHVTHGTPIHPAFHAVKAAATNSIYSPPQRIFIYEIFQELQRINAYLRYQATGLDNALAQDLLTLYRLTPNSAIADFVITEDPNSSTNSTTFYVLRDGTKPPRHDAVYERHGVRIFVLLGKHSLHLPEWHNRGPFRRLGSEIVRRLTTLR
jgi:hypothetical protein